MRKRISLGAALLLTCCAVAGCKADKGIVENEASSDVRTSEVIASSMTTASDVTEASDVTVTSVAESEPAIVSVQTAEARAFTEDALTIMSMEETSIDAGDIPIDDCVPVCFKVSDVYDEDGYKAFHYYVQYDNDFSDTMVFLYDAEADTFVGQYDLMYFPEGVSLREGLARSGDTKTDPSTLTKVSETTYKTALTTLDDMAGEDNTVYMQGIEHLRQTYKDISEQFNVMFELAKRMTAADGN